MMPTFGLSVNPNQHYEMLKLHHMNLLNEIQETTLMMNLYQQQQLQQQGGGVGRMGYYGGGGSQMGGLGNGIVGSGGHQMGTGGNSNFLMGMMNQNQGMDGGGMGAGGMGGDGNNNMMAAPQAKNEVQGHDNASLSSASGSGSLEPASLSNSLSGSATNIGKTTEERALFLQKLKDDIAQREKEAAELEASLGVDKRRNDKDDVDSSSKSSKRMKKEAEMTPI